MLITNPEEFVAVLWVLAITKTTFSLVSSRSISPRAWRLGGRSLWHTKESLERQLFAVERTCVKKWIKKLCNHMQKPTGKPGEHRDHILRCIEIERSIMDVAEAAMLGVASAESGHSRDDDSSVVSSIVADSGVDAAADGGIGGNPQNNHNHISVGNEGDDEDYEVVAANESSFEVDDVVMACSCPQSLPMFVGGSAPIAARGGVSLAVASSSGVFIAARGGVPTRAGRGTTPVGASRRGRGGICGNSSASLRRRSPSSLFNSGEGGGGNKTKNLTIRKRGSLSKAINKMADSIDNAGGGWGETGSNMMISQQMFQQQMQMQLFQQQMTMQMNAMEKRAENSEKYLRRIAKAMVRRGGRDKRKRDGSDSDEEESLSNDDK
jgi:hypothetical protein